MMLRKTCFATSMCFVRRLSTGDNLLEVSELGGARKLVMNSLATRNSLSMDMMGALLLNLENTKEESLRCVILSANGPVFSSGHNLKQLASEDYDAHHETFSTLAKLATVISSASVPVLAAVDGVAAAAGCQLAAACDIVVATERSKFSTPGANFGIFCSGPGVTISRSVGRKAAARMVLTGLPIDAQEALQMGLISAICNNDALDSTVALYVEAIVGKSRAVVELGKRFFYKQLEMDLPSAYREGARVMADNLKLEDGKEGLRSFVEKRKPVWTHRR